jgi:hypothetical protein
MRLLALICGLIVCQLAVAVGGAGGATATCEGEQATIVGTPRADVLRGTPRRDVIVGLAGNDTILGLGGNDLICGDAGNDSVDAGGGNDLVIGGSGNDRIVGGAGHDDANGRSGNDRIFGGAGNDSAGGESGNDQIVGGEGNDFSLGGSGNDRIVGGAGHDIADGMSGNDELIGGDGNDGGYAGPGDDDISGGNGNDVLQGDDGDDALAGGEGDDFCVGEQKTGCEPAAVGGDLTAGTYLFDGFDPNVTLTVGDGWWSFAGLSFPDFVGVAQGPSDSPRFVGIFHVPDQAYDPVTGELVPLEEDFLTWLTSQECIDVAAGPTPATVAGVSGLQVDFSVGTDPACSLRAPSWEPVAGERERMFVIEVNGVDLIIEIATWNPAEFDAFLPEAEAVLDTVQFG